MQERKPVPVAKRKSGVAEHDDTSGEIELSGAVTRDAEDFVIAAQHEPHQADRDLRWSAAKDLRSPARRQPGRVDMLSDHGLSFHVPSVGAVELLTAANCP